MRVLWTACRIIDFCRAGKQSGEFEDYARKMFPQYREMNVTPWIIGEPQGVPGWNIPSNMMKVWPVREPIQPMTPIDFNGVLLRVIKEVIRQAKGQLFVVVPL